MGAGQGEVGRKFIAFTAEAITKPRTQGGPPGGDASRVQGGDGLPVIIDSGFHGADQRDIVHDLREVRQQFADLHTAFSTRGKFPWTAKNLAAGFRRIVITDLTRKGLQVVFCKLGLRVKEVHLTGTAYHKKRDHRFRLTRVWRRLASEIKGQSLCEGLGWRCGQAIAAQQPRQSQGAKPKRMGAQKVAAGTKGHGLFGIEELVRAQ